MIYRWFLVGFALVACGSKDPGSPAPQGLPVDPASATPEPPRDVTFNVHRFEPPAIELPAQAAFSLLDSGAPPRAALRYELAAGPASFHTETRLTSRQLANNTWSPKQTLPPIRTGLEITPAAPLAVRGLPGSIVGAPTPEATRYLATWQTIEDRRFTIGFDDRGQLGAIAGADGPDGATPGASTDELAQRLLATIVPLPEEPVGLGATWRVVTVLRQRPAIVKQTATYTLKARTATGWKIAIDIQRIGEPQLLLDPALPPDTSAELIALVRRFEGTLELARTRPLPRGKLAFSSTLHVRLLHRTEGVAEQIFEDTGTVTLTTAP